MLALIVTRVHSAVYSQRGRLSKEIHEIKRWSLKVAHEIKPNCCYHFMSQITPMMV